MTPVFRSRLQLLLAVPVTAVLTGCAGGLPQVERSTSTTLAAPLAAAAREAKVAPGRSGVWPLLQAGYARDARLLHVRRLAEHDRPDQQQHRDLRHADASFPAAARRDAV